MDPDSVPLKKKQSILVLFGIQLFKLQFRFPKDKKRWEASGGQSHERIESYPCYHTTNKHELKPAANRSALTQPFPGSLVG